ncbi:hypothetical protein ACTFIR_009962 [Dictyostelium discoideum]
MEREILNNFHHYDNEILNNNNNYFNKNYKYQEFKKYSPSIPPLLSPFSSINHIPFQQKNNPSLIPTKYIPSIYKNLNNNNNNYYYNNKNNNNYNNNNLKIQEKIQYDLSIEKIKVLEKTLISLDEMIETLENQASVLKQQQIQIQEKEREKEKENNSKLDYNSKSKSRISYYVKKMKPFEENRVSQCYWNDCKDEPKKIFDNLFELGEHIDEHVNSLTMTQLKCKWKDCQASQNTFYNKYSLINHIRYRHTGIKPFTCRDNNCRKAFVRKADLDSHESSHQKRNLSLQKSNDQLFEIKI